MSPWNCECRLKLKVFVQYFHRTKLSHRGGNDPAIVFPDVDVDKVAQNIATWAFLNSGQVCLNLKRIYVHESIYEEFKAAMVKHSGSFTLGEGSRPGVTHGPLQNQMQYTRVKTFFDDIAKQGWEVALGGDMPASEDAAKGYFIKPTIIDRPPEKSRIVVEEPFGMSSSVLMSSVPDDSQSLTATQALLSHF